jgi:hypothetical protein
MAILVIGVSASMPQVPQFEKVPMPKFTTEAQPAPTAPTPTPAAEPVDATVDPATLPYDQRPPVMPALNNEYIVSSRCCQSPSS